MGTAAGSIRSAISSVAGAVYISVLTNRLTEAIPAEVPPILIKAGLPASSVPAFMKALTTGHFKDVAGLTPDILAIGMKGYRFANAHAYSTVFYVSIAFTGAAVVLSFFAPNVDDKMTDQVAVVLHGGSDRKAVEGEAIRNESTV
jgi:hypothetical protein